MIAEEWPVRLGIAAFYFFGILANGLWYYAKFILRANGYPASYLWHRLGDLKGFWRLASTQPEPRMRLKYRAVFIGIYVSAALFFLMAFLFFFPYVGRYPATPR